MKGEVVEITKGWNDTSCKYFWTISINTEEEPELKMGNCEVKQ